METVLSYRGYGIPLSAGASVISRAKALATVSPLMGHMQRAMGIPPKKYYFFAQGQNYLYLPKQLAIKEFGPPKKTHFLAQSADLGAFNGTLRPYQEEAVDAYLKSAEVGKDGVISLHCGAGKTTVALAIAARLGMKTLVIVNEENLGKQWEERIAQFLPRAKVGWIQRDRCEIDGNDIVIAMLQTLAVRKFDVKETLAKFGLVMVDEAHTIGSEVYTRCLMQACAPYMLGLTATPRRKDGLTDVIHWFLGNVVVYRPHAPDSTVKVDAVHYESHEPDYAEQVFNVKGLLDSARMMNKVASWRPRNELIADKVLEVLKESPLRQVLVLTQRRELQLEPLKELLIERGLPETDIGVLVGRDGTNVKQHEATVNHAKTARVILATYHKAKQGLDIPTLNCLVLATPERDVEQSVGRILRGLACEREINPLIVDVVDPVHRNYMNMWGSRKRFYGEKGYQISLSGKTSAETSREATVESWLM